MTARAKQLWESLNPRVLKQIKRLARSLNESEETVIEKAIALFDREQRSRSGVGTESEIPSHPTADPKYRLAFAKYMSAIAKRTNSKMTAAQKTARGEAGGAGRAKKLSPEDRKKIAKAAATARWAKKKNKPSN